MEWDLSFICNHLASLSGTPTRLYRAGQLVDQYAMVRFPVDPVKLVEAELLRLEDPVSYLVTPYEQLYGIVRSREDTIIMGPSRLAYFDEGKAARHAFMLGLADDAAGQFISAMRSIPVLGLESFLRMLCLVQYYLSGETVDISDLILHDQTVSGVARETPEEEEPSAGADVHNTVVFEQRLLSYVRTGDTEQLREFLSSTSHGREGMLASDPIRQAKNTFVVTATLVSRAAMEGGVAQEDALGLSDAYIQRCEMLGDCQAIIALEFHMLMDYTSRVDILRHGQALSPFALSVKRYIHKHLRGVIRMDELAGALHMSRCYVSSRFSRETGISVTRCIHEEKIAEAKRLLTTTDKPLGEISEYLAFSSQSHFQNIFRRYTGMSPRAFRNRQSIPE